MGLDLDSCVLLTRVYGARVDFWSDILYLWEDILKLEIHINEERQVLPDKPICARLKTPHD